MFSNISTDIFDAVINYPITDSNLPFSEYISQTRNIIESRREDLSHNQMAASIIAANSPFEYRPVTPAKRGALLIHGLLDCPFTFREIGSHLERNGILARAILLPGHGTKPDDLMTVTYHDWLQAVRYGIESLKKEVEEIYLIGYSTGAALAVYHALQDSQIAGIILLSPAIKVRAPVDIAANWIHLTNYFGKNRHWVYHCEENDYVKYKSIAFNGVKQVSKLTETVREINHENPCSTPIHMILSREDETISSHDAIDFFSSLHHPKSKMLLYTSIDHAYPDSRIETRNSSNIELNIAHLSHPCLSFSADNSHYGQQGDYKHAARADHNIRYGAYNRIEMNAFDTLFKLGLAKYRRRVLTYNPDFSNMVESIHKFISQP